ncbi:MAG TPA: hypothetical protein VGN35_11170 [Jatrophihabitantaceae bacterium]|jgi:hypothetical protein|nr:hypothetical protein [Jatrophihabitantaceae bacterium]
MTRRRFRLRWRRRQLQRALVVLAVIFVVGAIALFVQLYKSSSPNGTGITGSGDGAAGLGAGPGGTGSTSITGGSGDTSILKDFPTELTSKLGHNFRGQRGHTVVLTVATSGTVSRLGYLVPSADRDQFGDHRNVARGWTQTFTARGPYGPYSAIFIQTDRAGTPVHCTVTVDGVEKDSETISGEYGRGLCYG